MRVAIEIIVSKNVRCIVRNNLENFLKSRFKNWPKQSWSVDILRRDSYWTRDIIAVLTGVRCSNKLTERAISLHSRRSVTATLETQYAARAVGVIRRVRDANLITNKLHCYY